MQIPRELNIDQIISAPLPNEHDPDVARIIKDLSEEIAALAKGDRSPTPQRKKVPIIKSRYQRKREDWLQPENENTTNQPAKAKPRKKVNIRLHSGKRKHVNTGRANNNHGMKGRSKGLQPAFNRFRVWTHFRWKRTVTPSLTNPHNTKVTVVPASLPVKSTATAETTIQRRHEESSVAAKNVIPIIAIDDDIVHTNMPTIKPNTTLTDSLARTIVPTVTPINTDSVSTIVPTVTPNVTWKDKLISTMLPTGIPNITVGNEADNVATKINTASSVLATSKIPVIILDGDPVSTVCPTTTPIVV
ncbi:hypothetical protein PV326_004947 [Microctonus aethiopoides]|nr:hypothetical protein PV326_004947 [Microctonus aethiopoides]